jgi:hypothetical protein
MDLTLEIDEPRDEGIKDLVYYFIFKSVLIKKNITNALNKIERLLQNTVVNQKVLKILEVNYLHVSEAKKVNQVGFVKIVINWTAYSLAVNSGKGKFKISKDDPLGSMSPAMSELANHLRMEAIKHSVNDLTWAVTWVDEVYNSESRWSQINKENGLVKPHEENDEYNATKAEFDKAKKKRIVVNLGVANEADFEVLWLRD